MYSDDELLMLSGIQHIAFCERQYALIYIEDQWEDNVLTIQGDHLHKTVDDPFESDKRDDVICLRSVPVLSYSLGLTGKADLVELLKTDDAVNTLTLHGLPGQWKVRPVEYKRGKPKPDVCDEVQLCAQAICLEEMYGVKIDQADLFYGQPRRRKTVDIDDNLRKVTVHYASRMHQLFTAGSTPPPEYLPKCKNCSLFNICQPVSMSKKRNVGAYYEKQLRFDP